jgi:hypothetical protein
MPRYLFKADVATFSIGGSSERMEMWFGIDSEAPIDLAAYFRESGYDFYRHRDGRGDRLVPGTGVAEGVEARR